MRTKLIAVLALIIVGTCGASRSSAQTSNFTWQGGTTSNGVYNAQFATIDNYTTNASIGFAGNVNIANGNNLREIFLPDPGTCSIPRNPDGSCSGEQFPNFPNNGKLDVCNTITWGAKQWGTRSDGTTMDGSKVGDYYTVVGTTSCTLWNGSVNVTLIPFHEFDYATPCTEGRGRVPETCDQDDLRDVLKNGSGSVSCVPGSGTFGACGS